MKDERLSKVLLNKSQIQGIYQLTNYENSNTNNFGKEESS